MSYEARTWAWQQAKARTIDDPLDLLILLNLADVADQYGGNSYPSQARLVSECLSSERTIRRRLTLLVERGLLEVEAPATRKRPTTYRLVGVNGWAANLAAQSDGSAAIGRPLGGHLAATVLRQPSDKEELEQEELVTNTRVVTHEETTDDDDPEKTKGKGSDYRFEDVWAIYPMRRGRKVGKEKARDQWRKLTYEDKGRCFKAVRTFASERPELPPDMFRWLRDRTWQDYLEPAAAAPAGATRGAGPAPARKRWEDMTEEEYAIARRGLSEMELLEAREARRRAEVLRAAQEAGE